MVTAASVLMLINLLGTKSENQGCSTATWAAPCDYATISALGTWSLVPSLQHVHSIRSQLSTAGTALARISLCVRKWTYLNANEAFFALFLRDN